MYELYICLEETQLNYNFYSLVKGLYVSKFRQGLLKLIYFYDHFFIGNFDALYNSHVKTTDQIYIKESILLFGIYLYMFAVLKETKGLTLLIQICMFGTFNKTNKKIIRKPKLNLLLN